jgi:uncharacterized protein YdaU (DUF1376 family)
VSLPYFPMFPADFDADTGHLTLAEDGAYNRLLRLQWRCPGCKMPGDLEWIFRKSKAVTEADRAVIESVIAEFFTRKGGKIWNARLLKEHIKSDVAHSKRVAAGSKGGAAKARKTKESGPINAVAMPKQPEPEPEPYIKEANASFNRPRATKPDKPPPKRAVQLPPDWAPSDRNISDASDRNFNEAEIHEQAAAFRDYHHARGNAYKDWDAAWRTWLGNARRFARPAPAPRPGVGSAHHDLFAGFQRAASRIPN